MRASSGEKSMYLSGNFAKHLARSECFLGNRESLGIVFFEDSLDMTQRGALKTADPIGECNSIVHGCKCASASRRIQLERVKGRNKVNLL